MEKKYLVAVIIVLILVVVAILVFPKNYNQTGFQSDVIAQNLQVPWAIDFLPNNTMIFTQRDGEVKIIDPAGSETVGKMAVTAQGESGLLGLAVDPDFSNNNYIYVYYTASDGNRVSRFVFNGTLKNETILLDKIPSNNIHNGGRIKFGPDGLLYITTGDAGNNASAQDLNSLAGKVLRMDKNGSVPVENPYNNYVYTYGHRDPQGLAWSSNGTLYESEHGDNHNDEINILVSGGNYGWPLYQGNNTAPGYILPMIVYTDYTLAPSGIAFYNNKLYVAGLRGSQLRQISLTSNGSSFTGQQALFTQLGRIREVVSHDGYLYIATSNTDGRGVPQLGDDKIIRITVN
ncbi:Quinoprotein glucose dehydrogenase [Methanobacterium lacus]|uniref:Quinoprotein glucose dehydrogenase n=1 Tax=Methanobacterium lacus (strain AL-21) TaxID=877455 RepID=F0T914_METLA|nr:PQQ-dependent sugar dehydrogenase [Methanobacterium lacus]ADZ08636.1 Quinoprotein glucose dehydrogenase [Methanobacterium lacus]